MEIVQTISRIAFAIGIHTHIYNAVNINETL